MRSSNRHSILTFDDVRAVALALPGAEEYSSHGSPAIRVNRRFLSRLWPEEPGVIVLAPIDDDERRFLMETRPDAFFVTEHHRRYRCVLVRLAGVGRAELASLVEERWRRLASRKLLAQREAAPQDVEARVATGGRARGKHG